MPKDWQSRKSKATGRRHNAIRWTLEVAASEFNINPRTLAKRCKTASIEFGNDRKFSTVQICAAVFGDIEGERLRLTRAQADERELSNAAVRKELVNFSDLLSVAHRALSAMTACIMGMTHIEVEDREKIIAQLRSAGTVMESGNGGSDPAAEV
jgi:hypothetical protein